MVASCCDFVNKYIIEDGDLSREELDKMFGENNYELTIEKKFQDYKEFVKKYCGENSEFLRKLPEGILIKESIMSNGLYLGDKIEHIKFSSLEVKYVYKYKIKINNKEIILCGCPCHVIGSKIIH